MKLTKFLFVALLFVFVSGTVFSQLSTKYFYVGVSCGVTNYKGDLDDNFTLKFTKPGLGFIGGLRFHPHMTARLSFNQGWMKASDVLARDETDPRYRRNLSFRSPLTEAALTFTYEFFANNRKFRFRPQYTPYLFGGAAVFAFRPQAKLRGEWIDLQPLGTEGQFLPGCAECPEPYGLVQVSIPFGAGVRYKLTDKLDLWVELGLRKTFTDYLDDVSGEYPADMNAMLSQNWTSWALSDRIDRVQYGSGARWWNGIRGDNTQADWYVLTMVGVTYILDWVKCPKFR